MDRTTAGWVLVGGLVVGWIGLSIAWSANAAESTPNQDWFYGLLNFFGVMVCLTGAAMFFFGAQRFAKKD